MSAADFATELREVGRRWYELGIFLHVNESQLRQVETCHKDEGSNRCLIELYLLCTQMDIELTWDRIAEALEKLEFSRLAKKLRTGQPDEGGCGLVGPEAVANVPVVLFNHQPLSDVEMESSNTPTQSINPASFVFESLEESDTSCSSSPLTSSCVQTTTPDKEEKSDDNMLPYIEVNYDSSEKINDLFLHFSSLETDIVAVINRTMGVDKLQQFISSHFCIDEIPPDKATTRSVLHRLRHECGHHEYLFFLKGLIKYQLDGNQSLTEKIKSYELHSKSLQPSLPLGSMVTNGKPHSGPKAVEIKLNIKWASVTLRKFDLWLKEHFRTSYPDITSMRVKRGCISVSWLTDKIEEVEHDIRAESRVTMVSYGVISVRVGGKMKYIEQKNHEERFYPMIENLCDDDMPVNNMEYTNHIDHCIEIEKKDINQINGTWTV